MHRTSRRVLWIAAGLVLLLFTSALAGPGLPAPEILDVRLPTNPGPIVITSDSVHMESTWTPPEVRPAAPAADAWKHDQRSQSPYVLAGHPGQLTTDVYVTKGLRLTRETWLDNARNAFAVRLRLRNTGTEPLQLDRLVPLTCSEAAGTLFKTPPESWTFLVQQRQKNDQPGLRILKRDEIVPCDPLCVIRSGNEPNAPGVLVGFVSQLGCLSNIAIQSRNKGRNVQFTAECEMDGIELPPGGERAGQWAYVSVSRDTHALIADFADRMGAYHGVKTPPANAPSVLCTWYYYGTELTEALCREDLAALAKEHVPFDVFLIDDCWQQAYGDWQANDRWPGGMKAVADQIRATGYTPGLWTCPYLAAPNSRLVQEHPEWLLKLADGSRCIFSKSFVLDPTFPGVCEHLENEYRRMARDWGYSYHKMDFMRPVFLDPKVKFYDRTVTRLEAYRMGLEAIRRGMGPDVYVSVCGGHYGGSIGLADTQRSGSDVGTHWEQSAIVRFQQNLLRTWMGRLWHTDADAMMVRLREKDDGKVPGGKFRLGRFTDPEAQVVALNQYLAGGIVCFTERFQELSPERKRLYTHVIPSVNSPAVPLPSTLQLNDRHGPCPSQLLTRVTPRCDSLAPWITVTAINWTDESRDEEVVLSPQVLDNLAGPAYLVFDWFEQRLLGRYEAGARIPLGKIAPHSARLLRIASWDGRQPVLAGTDLHFSGGGVEIADWQPSANGVEGRIDTRWQVPVKITVAFPAAPASAPTPGTQPASETSIPTLWEHRPFATRTIELPAGATRFTVRPPG